jgi:hypothetical protein
VAAKRIQIRNHLSSWLNADRLRTLAPGKTNRVRRNAAVFAATILIFSGCSILRPSENGNAVKGTIQNPEGYRAGYTFQWGKPTVKASGCAASPPLGRINLPFTLTMKNLNGDRSLALQQVAMIETWTNIPKKGGGTISDFATAFDDDESAAILDKDCSNQVCGFYSSQVLPANGSCTMKASITNVPENIPENAKLLLRLQYRSDNGAMGGECPQVIEIPFPKGDPTVTQLANSWYGHPTITECQAYLVNATPTSPVSSPKSGACPTTQELIDQISPEEWKGKGFVGSQTIESRDGTKVLLFIDAAPTSGVQTGYQGIWECTSGKWAPVGAVPKDRIDAAHQACTPYEAPVEFNPFASEWCRSR